MPLSTRDPYYKAEVVPESIDDMAAPLCSAYGVGAGAFGAKGNLVHTSGYHRSRDWVLNSKDSKYKSRDYSVQRELDKQGDPDWISAFDFTPGDWGTAENRRRMIEITKRMRAAARRNDPRLADLFEFAGTEDGKTVITFYCQGGEAKAPFDLSHLDHIHGSFYRGRAANNHRGVIEVMLGLEDNDMGDTYIGGIIPLDATAADPFNVNVGIVGGGAADPRPAWMNFTNDGPELYAVRAVWTTGDNNYKPLEFRNVAGNYGYAGTVFKKGVRGTVQLPENCVSVALSRQAVDVDGMPMEPDTDNPVKGKYIGFAIERGAVES